MQPVVGLGQRRGATMHFSTTWSDAIRRKEFGMIADWFISYFFIVGLLALVLAGVAAGPGGPRSQILVPQSVVTARRWCLPPEQGRLTALASSGHCSRSAQTSSPRSSRARLPGRTCSSPYRQTPAGAFVCSRWGFSSPAPAREQGGCSDCFSECQGRLPTPQPRRSAEMALGEAPRPRRRRLPPVGSIRTWKRSPTG